VEVTRGVVVMVANGVAPEVNGEVDMVEMLVAMEAGEVMAEVMTKGTEAVAMEVMVVTPADPEAKPQEVCPGVCGVASKCEVGVAAAATVDAVAPQETSLIRERGIKNKEKKKKLQNMLFPHSESALFKFKKTKQQAKTITKYLQL
jgi:hypothetical protein